MFRRRDGECSISLRAAFAFRTRDRSWSRKFAPRGGTILDCCAAPGGKTLILAERNPKARIVACESSPQRLAQMRERLATLGSRVECRLADAATLEDDAAYDVVLADVPCSGTGTLGRNPEIRHRLKPADLDRGRQNGSVRFFRLPCVLFDPAAVLSTPPVLLSRRRTAGGCGGTFREQRRKARFNEKRGSGSSATRTFFPRQERKTCFAASLRKAICGSCRECSKATDSLWR